MGIKEKQEHLNIIITKYYLTFQNNMWLQRSKSLLKELNEKYFYKYNLRQPFGKLIFI